VYLREMDTISPYVDLSSFIDLGEGLLYLSIH
jgi:hypothetical protein